MFARNVRYRSGIVDCMGLAASPIRISFRVGLYGWKFMSIFFWGGDWVCRVGLFIEGFILVLDYTVGISNLKGGNGFRGERGG